MSGYTRKNLKEDVENVAPTFDMPAEMEGRFARTAIGGEDPRDAEMAPGWWTD